MSNYIQGIFIGFAMPCIFMFTMWLTGHLHIFGNGPTGLGRLFCLY